MRSGFEATKNYVQKRGLRAKYNVSLTTVRKVACKNQVGG